MTDKTHADRLHVQERSKKSSSEVADEIARIKELFVRSDCDKEDVITYAKNVIADRQALSDYRASKVEDDKLVERLRVFLHHRSKMNGIDPDIIIKVSGVVGEPAQALTVSDLEFAISRLQSPAQGWVAIDDPIVETWADPDGPNEGYVDIGNRAGCRFPDSTWFESYNGFAWHSDSGFEICNPTHAMLPIAPPQNTEG